MKILIAAFAAIVTAFIAVFVIQIVSGAIPQQHYTYPVSTENSFMTGCLGGTDATPSRCDCVLAYFHAHVSYEQLVIDADTINSGGQQNGDMAKAQISCVNK
jgi:hypothetical protein